ESILPLPPRERERRARAVLPVVDLGDEGDEARRGVAVSLRDSGRRPRRGVGVGDGLVRLVREILGRGAGEKGRDFNGTGHFSPFRFRPRRRIRPGGDSRVANAGGRSCPPKGGYSPIRSDGRGCAW